MRFLFARIAPVLLIAILTTTALSALDFGGNINSRSSLTGDTPSFRNTASAFFRHNPVISGEATGRFLFEHSVTAVTGEDDNSGWSTETVYDLDQLRLDGIFPEALGPPTVFRLSAGRFTFAEPTGLVFSDRVDGTSFALDVPELTVTVGGGYTGLLAALNSGVSVSADDELDAVDPDITRAPPRIVGTAFAVFPELFGRHTLSAGTLAQWDRPSGEDISEKIDSQYLFAGLDGPLGADLYYEASVAAGYVQRFEPDELNPGRLLDPDTGLGIGAEVLARYFLDARERSVLTATARFGSPEGENISAFRPVTGTGLSLLRSPPPDDLGLLMLDYALRPFAGEPRPRSRSLEVSAYAAVDFSSDVNAERNYRGVETGTRLTVRPFADLGGQLWIGGYLPGEELGDGQFLGRLELSTSF